MPLAAAAAVLDDDASPARDRTCLLHALSPVSPLPVQRYSHVALVLCPLSRARVRREVTFPPCQTGQCPAPVLALHLYLPLTCCPTCDMSDTSSYPGISISGFSPCAGLVMPGPDLRHKTKSAKHTTWSGWDPLP